MSDLLQNILPCTPETWEYRNYSTQVYHQILVSGSEEYKVIKDFPRELLEKVRNVYRIQNPYLWGRYTLRTEQLQTKGYQVYERTYYHPISQVDKTKVMEYNLDYRRYSHRYDGQYNSSSKKPYLYSEPRVAMSAIPSHDKVLVVVKTLELSNNNSSFKITKDLDTEYYPAYIVEF